MVANSGMKHKSETILEVIRDLAFDFVLTLLLFDRVPFIWNFSTEGNIRYIIYPLMSTKCQ